MMNDLQIFKNAEFGEIRTATSGNEPMFCLSDVCRALSLSNVTEVKKRLGEKGLSSIETLTKGGNQKLLYINEANLYKTIFQSRKESAQRFTDWVTVILGYADPNKAIAMHVDEDDKLNDKSASSLGRRGNPGP